MAQPARLDGNSNDKNSTAREQAIDRALTGRQKQLAQTLDNSVHALATLIPDILQVTGTSRDEHEYAMAVGDVQKNRIQYSLMQFLKTITSWGPAVMVIDDLQWADAESLALLRVIVREVPGLSLVGCYRSNEVDETSIFAKWMRDMTTESVATLHEIQVKPTSQDVLSVMLTDVLSLSPGQDASVRELATVVHQKTMGNPFFTKEFLKILHQNEALAYSTGTECWVWDIPDICDNIAATPNVIEMMVHKMSQLPASIVQVLPLAACLGTTFRDETLETVANVLWEDSEKKSEKDCICHPKESMSWDRNQWLEACVEEGLLGPGENRDDHKWIHDKFREAALAMIIPEKLQSFRFRVGQAMMRHLCDEELTRSIFTVADLLNADPSKTIKTRQTLLRMVEINIQAAQSAMSLASYCQAVGYLEAALARLPSNAFRKHYEVALELHSSAAEAYFCIGESEKVEVHSMTVIDQENIPLSDKFRAYNALIDCMGNLKQFDRVIKFCVLLLDELKCRLPRKRFLFHTLAGIGRIKMMSKSNLEISKMKEMTNESDRQIMHVLDTLATYAYVTNSPLLPLCIFKLLRWTTERGLSEFAPTTFAAVGLLLCSPKLNDFSGGRQYGEIALSMVENMGYAETESRTLLLVYGYVMIQTTEWADCIPPLLRSYQAGLASGDIESACYAIMHSIVIAMSTGKSLKTVHQDAIAHIKQLRDLKMNTALNFLELIDSCVSNLTGQSQNTHILADAEEKLEEYRRLGSVNEGNVREQQMHLAVFFGKDEYGADIVLDIEKNGIRKTEGMVSEILMNFESAVVCYGASRKTNKKKYFKAAHKYHGLIKTWVKAGNFNLIFALHLLDAEEAMGNGKIEKAFQEYNLAASSAQEAGFCHCHGLVYTRWGNASAELDDFGSAIPLWKKAVSEYNEWGAQAVARKLRKKIATARKRLPTEAC